MTHDECCEWAEENDTELVFLDDADEAIIGIVVDGLEDCRIAYSKRKFLEILQKQGMTESEAEEWYEYNTLRSLPYMGKHSPIFLEESCG